MPSPGLEPSTSVFCSHLVLPLSHRHTELWLFTLTGHYIGAFPFGLSEDVMSE